MKFRDRVKNILEVREMRPFHLNKKNSKEDERYEKMVNKKVKMKCAGCGQMSTGVAKVTIKKDLPKITKKFLCPKCRRENE